MAKRNDGQEALADLARAVRNLTDRQAGVSRKPGNGGSNNLLVVLDGKDANGKTIAIALTPFVVAQTKDSNGTLDVLNISSFDISLNNTLFDRSTPIPKATFAPVTVDVKTNTPGKKNVSTFSKKLGILAIAGDPEIIIVP